MELIGIFFVGCGLLILAGVAKATRPDDTARALVVLQEGRNPSFMSFAMMRSIVRVGATLETALGVLALLFPQPSTAAPIAASYMLFLCTVALVRRRGGPLSTCGCFGRADTPATGFHLLLNALFVAVAITVALQPPHETSLAALLAQQPWHGVPLVFTSGVGVWLAYLALSPLAALEGARRLVGRAQRKALTA